MKIFIKKVMYNKPAVIVFWSDGSKTSATCGENDTYDKEKGLALCIVKRLMSNSRIHELFQAFAGTEGCDKEVIENPFVKEMENLTRSIFENMKAFEKVSKQFERTGTYASSYNPNAGKKTTANSSNSRSNTRSCCVDPNVGKGKCCHMYQETKVENKENFVKRNLNDFDKEEKINPSNLVEEINKNPDYFTEDSIIEDNRLDSTETYDNNLYDNNDSEE